MNLMLSFLLLAWSARPDIASLDALARARDAKGLAEHTAGLDEAAFAFLGRSGAFGTGRKGWHAYELVDPAGGATYVVFGTPLTTQDYGEFVFEVSGEKMVRLQDERETRGWKTLHYDFTMDFVPAQKRANIVCAVRLRRDEGAKPSVHLRLSPNYRVSKVTDSSGAPLRYAQASGVVSVAPPPGDQPTVVLTYSGVVDQPTFAGAIVSDEVMLTNDYWWPSIARGPATVTTTATMPADWTLVTHGKKTSDTVQGGSRKTTFRMDVPISYLSLSAGKFDHVEKEVAGVTYHVWSNDMTQADMRAQLDLMPDVVQFYSRFAPYPFDDWGAMVTELYGGGALEAYSFATYGTGWLPDEDTHEPAHTWFGGLLSNTYLNAYWNESFANFCGGLYNRERPVGNQEERRRAFVNQATMTRDYQSVPIAKGSALIGGVASSLGYGKGALVLQQLERDLGTEKTVAAMQSWIKDNPKGEAAEWDGFEKAVNKVAGEDMSWFFDQWVRNAGAPNFEITEVGYVGNEVRGRVDFRGVPYRLKTEVFAEHADGTFTHVDVVLNPQRKEGVSEFKFTLPKKPTFLSFDPYDRILRERSGAGPSRLQARLRSLRPVVDPQHDAYARSLAGLTNLSRATENAPTDPDGTLLIGHPSSMPAMRELCRKVGFQVEGDKLTYKGTTIDLDDGAAFALVDLGNGKSCAIALGTTSRSPELGNSRLCVVDGKGRFLRGIAEPRREGTLVFRLS